MVWRQNANIIELKIAYRFVKYHLELFSQNIKGVPKKGFDSDFMVNIGQNKDDIFSNKS